MFASSCADDMLRRTWIARPSKLLLLELIAQRKHLAWCRRLCGRECQARHFLLCLELVGSSVLFLLVTITAVSAQTLPTAGTTQGMPTQNSTLQPQPGTQTLGPNLPLSSVPTTTVNVRFIVEHRSALSGHLVRVRGVVSAALLGEAACPPDRGICMQPSLILEDADCGDKQLSCSIRMLMPQNAKAEDYPHGKPVEIRGLVNGSETSVLMTHSD